MKKFITYIFCLAPWFVASLIKVDYSYLDKIKTPFFTPPSIFYGVAWSIIYVLVAISINSIINSYKFKDIPLSYKITLLINYLFNQSFTLVFFGLKSNFLGFVASFATFISTLFLYEETTNLDSRKKILLVPYLILGLFATILSLTIFFLNIAY